MDITVLDRQVSVSGQITIEDVAMLVESGVDILVCNRPDNESEDQTPFNDIEAIARSKGIAMVNIAFSGGQMRPEQAEAFAELLSSGKRIHAYCRTGNRSTQIWKAATKDT